MNYTNRWIEFFISSEDSKFLRVRVYFDEDGYVVHHFARAVNSLNRAIEDKRM
jgi:hypothetical protein